jgi:hypothetical protein
MLTQAQLKELLHYDTETGLFTWLTSKRNSVKAGSIAGCKKENGYILIKIHNKRYKAHRLAFLYVYGRFPEKQIDHINRIRSDNRICNLREATNQQNLWNQSIRKDNTSGYIGVSMFRKKYVAQITVDSKLIHIGTFATAEKAGQAYLAAKSVYHVI